MMRGHRGRTNDMLQLLVVADRGERSQLSGDERRDSPLLRDVAKERAAWRIVDQSRSVAKSFCWMWGCANGAAEAKLTLPRLSGRTSTIRQAKLSAKPFCSGR